jgi:hypothetical protein
MATPAEMDVNAEEALKDAAGHKRLGRGIVEWWG